MTVRISFFSQAFVFWISFWGGERGGLSSFFFKKKIEQEEKKIRESEKNKSNSLLSFYLAFNIVEFLNLLSKFRNLLITKLA